MNTTVSLNNNKTNKQTNVTVNAAISSTSSLHTGEHVTPVYLNLYDLGGCTNTCVHSIGLSFYHCAVQAHSAEYGYMGHPYKFTGLYKTSKHDSRFHLYRLRDSIEVGWTWFSEKQMDQIVNDLKPFYLGCDYHTIKKNSIYFAKYLLEQLSNDPELKHIEPIKIIELPSYIDRGRRLSDTLQFLQMFDTEKDIAEINILYFLYMKYEGNLEEICQILQCETIDKLKRTTQLIEQGILQKKLPIFSAFTTFDMKTAYNCLYENNPDVISNDERLTLTDIFHQFDTITLRGRTSIDRYLNIQRAKESAQYSHIQNQESMRMTDMIIKGQSIPFDGQDRETLSHIQRASLPQGVSHNQGRTPLGSNISGLELTATTQKQNIPSIQIAQTIPILIDPFIKYEDLHMRTANPLGTVLRLQETKADPDLRLTELRLTTNGDQNPLSNRQRKMYSSHKRKLPRDLELNNDLYTITNQNSLGHNYTNNAVTAVCSSSSQFHPPDFDIISFHKANTGEETDSSV